MPGGRGKPRYLRLVIRVVSVPRGITPGMVKRALLAAIDRGGYEIPKGWIVEIGWTNKKGGTLKYDEFTNAMIDSTLGGRGWDIIVREHIERMK